MQMIGLSVAAILISFFAIAGCGSSQTASEDRQFHTSGNRDADQRAEQRIAKDEQIKGKNAPGQDEKSPVAAQAAAAKQKTLYDRLGGQEGIQKLVDDFTDRALADPRVNWKRVGVTQGGIGFKRNVSVEWKPTDEQLNAMKLHIAQFLALAAGGPSKYEGKEMKNAHAGLHITNAEFDASVGDFKASLDKLGVATQEQKEVLGILESVRPMVAEER
jgi:hemoglobin